MSFKDHSDLNRILLISNDDNDKCTMRRNVSNEKWKTLISVLYFGLICVLKAFVQTVVHDKVPDMQKYPPLPDLILDNVPVVPWAFAASELIGSLFFAAFLLILTFHKHRLIVLRRLCTLYGTLFFFRSLSMLITSLPVPSTHLKCSPNVYGSWSNRFRGTL